MGIRFRCPNGHTLHVKSFLAGKRGICPHCGVSVAIPIASDQDVLRERAERKAQRRAGKTPVWKGDSDSSAAGPAVGPAGTGQPVRPGAPKSATAKSATVHHSAAKTPDPIDESPQSVWYVRPPSGGQFGPAAGDVMRKWLAEGRVSSDSLVWREGWAEWCEAGAVFPHLPRAGGAASAYSSSSA